MKWLVPMCPLQNCIYNDFPKATEWSLRLKYIRPLFIHLGEGFDMHLFPSSCR